MLDIRKILYPTDFSAPSRAALPWAVRLAEMHGAELHMLHVLVLHAADVAGLEQHYERLGEEARAELRRLAGDHPEARIRLVTALRRGISAAPVVLDYAVGEDVDLVVMGSHGRRGVPRLFLGSVAEEVVRTSPCPALVVRARKEERAEGDGDGGARVRRVVAGVDFSSHSLLALDAARDVAAAFGASLSLVHVVETPMWPDFYVPVSVPTLNTPEIRERARVRLADLAAEAVRARPGLETDAEVRVGHTVPEIVSFAEERHADLVVLASHGLRGLERVLLGSVAEGVMRRAGCSVLVVKAFGKPFRTREEAGAAAGRGEGDLTP